jgi:hypothetical protein
MPRSSSSTSSSRSKHSLLSRAASTTRAVFGSLGYAAFGTPAAAKAVATTVLTCVALGGIGYGIVKSIPALNAFAAARVTVDPSKVRIVFSNPPAWMPNVTLGTIAREAHAAMATSSPLESEALKEVHQALLASGWFAGVEQVRRTGDTEIAVTAEFRVPFAMVRSGSDDHLIDVEGRRLPLCYTGEAVRPKLPLVIGVALPKPAESGALWLGSDLRAALNIIDLVRDRVWFADGQIHSIDTSRFGTEGIVELVTDRNTRIVWGGDPRNRSLSEMPPDRKLASLDALYRASRRVDDASGRTLDLRFDVVTLAPKPQTSNSASESEPIDEAFAANDP